jgi:DNA-binding MarR family transcriptional regulator
MLAIFLGEESHDRMHDACDALRLTPGLVRAVLSMPPDEVVPMRSLGRRWRCDASYVTSLVDGLEQRGIVERRAHPTDRRAKTIVLTDEGKRVKDALLDRLHEPPACFAVLTDEEQAVLRDLVAKVAAAEQAPA